MAEKTPFYVPDRVQHCTRSLLVVRQRLAVLVARASSNSRGSATPFSGQRFSHHTDGYLGRGLAADADQADQPHRTCSTKPRSRASANTWANGVSIAITRKASRHGNQLIALTASKGSTSVPAPMPALATPAARLHRCRSGLTTIAPDQRAI